ncbi:MAG: PAS domain-containing sensor histidine kinase [bacterium]
MAKGAYSARSAQTSGLDFLLKVLMLFRVVTITLLLGVTVVAQVKGSQILFFAPLYYIYLLIVAVYLATILFSSVFHQVTDIKQFSFIQVGFDLVLYTIIVFLSGGYESPFPFLYLFSILWASLGFPGGGYWTASFSSILYGAVVDLGYYGILLPPHKEALALISSSNPWDIIGRIMLYITAFFAVAFLGNQMGKRYRSTEEALTEKTADLVSLQHLSDIVFDSINSGIVVLGPDGRVITVNSSGADILGIDNPDEINTFAGDIFNDVPIENLCESAASGMLNRWEGIFTDTSGRHCIFGLSISRLKDPEKGYVVVFQDLTEFRDMEEKLKSAEKLSAVGRMAASIAHEVRNPLASMSGSIQMLKDSLELGTEDNDLMEIVLRETGRLNTLVEEFLTYARPPSPRFENEDLRKIVTETITILEGSADSNGIVLKEEIPDGPVIMAMDPGQMYQILHNLAKNSLEAIDGGGEILIKLEIHEDEDPPRAVLSVADTGSGISDDILPEIFEPFKTTKPKGTGLGLAIVYQLVQIHKGTIDVLTDPEKGTTITITLPARSEG